MPEILSWDEADGNLEAVEPTPRDDQADALALALATDWWIKANKAAGDAFDDFVEAQNQILDRDDHD